MRSSAGSSAFSRFPSVMGPIALSMQLQLQLRLPQLQLRLPQAAGKGHAKDGPLHGCTAV